MPRKGHSEEKIGCLSAGFYSWKRRYAGLGLNELRELRQLREQNRKLKGLVADLSLDKHILQEVLSEKPEARCAARVGARHSSNVRAERKPRLRAGRDQALDQPLLKLPRSAGTLRDLAVTSNAPSIPLTSARRVILAMRGDFMKAR